MRTSFAFGLLCCIVAALSFSLMTQSASAGFLVDSIVITPGSYDPDVPDPVIAYLPDGNATAEVWEHFDASPGSSYDLHIEGGTDEEDPFLTITKNVDNGSGFTWLGYTISLDTSTGNEFVIGSASSDTMDLISETIGLLTFGLPAPVPDGSSVSYTFTVMIPPGPFDFTLTQSPIIPEPTTMALAGIAGLMILAARRKQSL
jgi:hypothetical protein